MKILHLDSNHPLLLKMLTEAGFSNEENYKSSKVEVEEIISNYEGIVIRSRFDIDKQFLDAAKNLKFIARVGAGLESIDTEYAQKLGIKLIAAPKTFPDFKAETKSAVTTLFPRAVFINQNGFKNELINSEFTILSVKGVHGV